MVSKATMLLFPQDCWRLELPGTGIGSGSSRPTPCSFPLPPSVFGFLCWVVLVTTSSKSCSKAHRDQGCAGTSGLAPSLGFKGQNRNPRDRCLLYYMQRGAFK